MPSYTAGDVPLAYREAGGGAPLLLIHAFPLNSAMWEPQLAALGGALRVLAPDLRGFGESALGEAPASLDRYADDLVALMDTLGLERAAVAGLSMGGYIALNMLRRHRQRVSALVLADTRAGADSDEARRGRETSAQLAESAGAAAVGEAMVPRLLSGAAPAELRARVRQIVAGNSGPGVAAALRCMAVRPDSTGLLETVTVPTLVVVGEEDAITPPDEARRLHAGVPGSELALIPGAGHLANLEQPEAFSRAVAEFLARQA